MDKKSRTKIRLFWCDEEDPSNIKTYQTNGLPAKAAKKHLKPGIRAVASLFTVKSDNGRPNIFISDHLKEVVQELTNYRYPKEVLGEKAETPLKENDHFMDALRYLANLEHGGKTKLLAVVSPMMLLKRVLRGK